MTDRQLSPLAPDLPPRRRRDDGAAVAGIAPGLGRRQAEERVVRAAGAVRRACSPATASTARSGGPRAKARRWSWARCSSRSQPFREKMLFLRGLYNAEALIGGIHSCQTGNLLTGAHLAPGGEIRSGISCDQVVAERLRRPDQGAEPRAGLRAVDRGDPQELLDDLQLAHLVEFADHADAAGTVPGPGLRPPVPRRGRQGRQERARRRAAKTPTACSNKVSTVRPAAARRVPVVGPRGGAADRPGRARPAGCKAGGRRSPSPTCRARPTASRRTSTSTCG